MRITEEVCVRTEPWQFLLYVISRKQGAGSEVGTEPCVMTLKRAHVGFVYFRGQFCLSIVVLIDLDVL